MNTTTHLPPITMSSLDLARLEQMLEAPAVRQLPTAIALGDELTRATVLAPSEMPGNVVTMNSIVTCIDELSGEEHRLTLVYPSDADAATGKVSVLAPVGSALLGLSLGQTIDWQAPAGRHLRVRVTTIEYQPEAAGDLHL